MIYAQKLYTIYRIHEIHCILKYFECTWLASGHYTCKCWPVICFKVWRIYTYGFICCKVPWNIVKNAKTKPEGYASCWCFSSFTIYNTGNVVLVHGNLLIILSSSPLMLPVWPDTLNPRPLLTWRMCADHNAGAITHCHYISSQAPKAMGHMLQRAIKILYNLVQCYFEETGEVIRPQWANNGIKLYLWPAGNQRVPRSGKDFFADSTLFLR